MLNREITIKLTPREDGGLRVSSDDELGLILSGEDPTKVMALILPALEAIANYHLTDGVEYEAH